MAALISEIRPVSENPALWGKSSDALFALRHLRLSVTDRCNFRCRYCMPAEGVPKVAHADLLPLEELARLTRWLVAHTGIERVRLTGGEPLMRRGIEGLIAALASTPGVKEVCLTTNGTLLAQMAWALKRAGLSRVNVSLDSLDEDRFAEVSRGGCLLGTLDGIEAARAAGLTPIKINTVLRRSTWRNEVPALLDYAAVNRFEIRFIELMRTGTERAWCESEFVSVDEVCDGLGIARMSTAAPKAGSARKTAVAWNGRQVAVGWISPRSHPFCKSCDRLRMDARGRIRRCLMDPAQLDFTRLMDGTDDSSTMEAVAAYIGRKIPPQTMDHALAMSQIGG